jgi:PAS domain S-box-containing protein
LTRLPVLTILHSEPNGQWLACFSVLGLMIATTAFRLCTPVDAAFPLHEEPFTLINDDPLLTTSARRDRERAAQLAQSEQLLAGIVNNIVDGVITVDEGGDVRTLNPAAERLFGYKAEEVIGHNVSMLMFEPYRSEHDVYLANYLRTGERKIIGRAGRVLPARRKDGSVFQMDLAVTEFLLENRRHFVGVVRDMTDRNRVTELATADRMKDEFLVTLAHELRNPLAPIRNAVQVLSIVGAADPLLQQMRHVIERQVTHMVRLVDDLLNLSRISRGKLELRLERADLTSIVYHAAEMCRALVDSDKHELTITLPEEPVYLDADPVRLAEVFANLLNNACKYTEPGGRIWLHAERQGSDVVVTVKDTGVGIPPDSLASIFGMFTQMEPSLERSQGGLGIGLTLVKRLVEMHGGSVEARSEGSGKGSEFVVRLPLAMDSPKAQRPDLTGKPPVEGCRFR